MLTLARSASAGASSPRRGAGGRSSPTRGLRMALATVEAIRGLSLRAPRRGDASQVARLLEQFGYPAHPADVALRLDRMVSNPATYALVATVDRAVIGIAAMQVIDIIESDRPLVVLILLIVDERHRGRGAGTSLVQALELEAKARGSFGISVHSGQQRVGAHAFYRHLGYELTGERMLKIFASAE
jgi:predicted N-acetyltransferase YhbS